MPVYLSIQGIQYALKIVYQILSLRRPDDSDIPADETEDRSFAWQFSHLGFSCPFNLQNFVFKIIRYLHFFILA